MDQDDNHPYTRTPSRSDQGHGGHQRMHMNRVNPFQGEYDYAENSPKRARTNNAAHATPDASQATPQYQSFYNDMNLPQVPMISQAKPHTHTHPEPQTQPPKFTPITLLQFHDNVPHNMSALDALICQNVELFQSFTEEGSQRAQLGLRCVHCARAMQRHVDSCIIFPSSIETLASSVRLMKERHFPSCDALPASARQSFNQLRNSPHMNRENEESPEGRFSLSEFLYKVCKKSNIFNRQPIQTGIVASDLTYESSSYGHSDHASTSQYARSSTPAQKPQQMYDPAHNLVRLTGQQSPPPQYASHQQHRQEQSKTYNQSGFYENNDNSFPFVQTAHNIWECRQCINLPIGHRGERYAWYAPTPPSKTFMDDHLRTCSGGRKQRQQYPFYSHNQQQNSQSHYNQQHDISSQSQQFSSASSYHSSHPSSRSYQQDQMQMKPLYQPSHSSQQYSTGSSSQYHMSPQASMPNPYQNSYQTKPWRPSSRNTGFPSSQHPTSDSSFLKSPQADHAAYDHGDFSRIHRVQPDTSLSSLEKEELKNATEFLSKKATESSADDVQVLVEDPDKHLITDYFYHVMKQLRICHFKEEDRATRGGKRDSIQIGYGGLECIHCCHTANARKFFWSNVDRLSNSFSEIPGHVLKCKACPEATKQALLEIKKHHSSQMTEKSRGSQKTFLRRVWRRMHVTASTVNSEEERLTSAQPQELPPNDSIVTLGSDSPDTQNLKEILPPIVTIGGMSCADAAKALIDGNARKPGGKRTQVLLAIDQDKDWGLSDLDCFVRRNLEVFCATSAEAAAYTKGRGEDVFKGQVGIRCIHCSSSQDCYAVFPSSVDDIFSAVRAFRSKHLPQCSNLKDEEREKFDLLSEKCSSSFGSIVRQYYLKAAQSIGLRDCPNGGIKAIGVGGFKKTF